MATTPTPHQHQREPVHKDPSSSSHAAKKGITAGTPSLTKAETVLCGSTAGVISRFVVAPLDVVKIRLQMQTHRKDLPAILRRKAAAELEHARMQRTGSSASSAERLASAEKVASLTRQANIKYKGMLSGMTVIVREEGIRGLWKGNMAAEYLYLTYGGIQFLVYQQTKAFLARTAQASAQRAVNKHTTAPIRIAHTLSSSSTVQSFISGASAGLVATAFTYPFDLLRTRFAVQRDVKVYTGVVQAFQHIYRHDGIRGFYRGMSPSLIQVIPYMGIMFGSYDTLKKVARWMKKKAGVEDSAVASSSPLISSAPAPVKAAGQILLGLEDLICGGMSGIISKTGVFPFDTVRKRLQIQGSEQQKYQYSSSLSSPTSRGTTGGALPNSVWKSMLHIVRTEGYLALYKGLLPGLLKAAPASAVTFLVFTQAGTLIERIRRPPPSITST
ncbi:mitochondrial thiamine pyrophosphate transporter [Actinomortierella ambigua]|uniref:Mitochondrial thiamine pyrophosphate transporter n=1 Tax=Actinomortierella ambigua TaxID=1343610 RepID=A0A9P6PP48_9FUNG|nr:mitochondrial thiamine pyrophosphate transporter [Actinomortierella ambigua]